MVLSKETMYMYLYICVFIIYANNVCIKRTNLSCTAATRDPESFVATRNPSSITSMDGKAFNRAIASSNARDIQSTAGCPPSDSSAKMIFNLYLMYVTGVARESNTNQQIFIVKPNCTTYMY
jgi:hypothetical protein